MNEHESAALRTAIEEALPLLRGNTDAFRSAMSPVTDSLEALCATLQRTTAGAQREEAHAAAMLVSRDLLASALLELSAHQNVDEREVTRAIATLHQRVVAILESCSPANA